jgi:hypothetical protein
MTRRCPAALVVSGLLAAAVVTGCGPGEVRGTKLKGQLVVNGQPLKPLPGERVWVTFERTGSGGGKQVIMSSGAMQKDGTFDIEGQEKKGTPPGTYTVTIHGEFSSGDRENRFADLFPDGKSPFVVEVTDQEDQFFVIDIGARTITKQ